MPKRRSTQNVDDDDYEMMSDEDFVDHPRKNTKEPPARPRKVAKLSQSKLIISGGLTIQKDYDKNANIIRSHTVASHIISSKAADQMSGALVTWFDGVYSARGMPWRKPFDSAWNAEERGQRAYEVWVSEIMLQQTQVATVIPYYDRWMEKFPTIEDLAAASIDSVHALWKGLGYYSRASRLLEGAKKVIDTPSMKGQLPTTAKAMQSDIPGVGRYSAGAICSIAYDERVPVLDGNVNRLLSRVLALHASPKAKQTVDILWAAATSLVESPGAARPGNLNQALIELGSTVCKPKDPACGICPIRSSCGAYAMKEGSTARGPAADAADAVGALAPENVPDIEELCTLCEHELEAPLDVTSFPMKVEKKKPREETDLVHVLEWRPKQGSTDQRYFLLVKRPEGGLLGGLQEFPTLPNVNPPSSISEHMAKEALSAVESYLVNPVEYAKEAPAKMATAATDTVQAGLQVMDLQPAGEVLHIFSHIRKTYCLRWVILEGGSEPPALRATPVASTARHGKKHSAKTAKKSVKGRRKRGTSEGEDEEADIVECAVSARWVPIDEVRDANIGTGVVKIWDQVRQLWERS